MSIKFDENHCRSLFMEKEQWVPEAQISKCQSCGVAFGMLTRKHHCRSCGHVVCAACSTKEILTNKVCNGCYTKIAGKEFGRQLVSHLNAKEDTSDAIRMRLWLEAGADTEIKMAGGNTPLIKSAELGLTDAVRALLDHGANVDAAADDGARALMWAAAGGHRDVARLLCDSKADVEAKDNDGCPALLSAAFQGKSGVVQLLVDKGANLEATDKEGNTALLVAPNTQASESDRSAVVRLLVKRGANTEHRNKAGKMVKDFDVAADVKAGLEGRDAKATERARASAAVFVAANPPTSPTKSPVAGAKIPLPPLPGKKTG